MKRFVSYGVAALVGVGAAIALMRFITPPDTAKHVTFDELERDIEADSVDEIKIDDHAYRYFVRVDGHGEIREATGPTPTLSQLQKMHLSKPSARAPRIWFTR